MLLKYHIPEPPRECTDNFVDPSENCDHRLELRKHVCSNDTIQYRKQCILCGQSTSAISHAKIAPQEKAFAPKYDPDLQDNIHKQAYEDWRANNDVDRAGPPPKRETGWWAWYNLYLESDVWKQKRNAVLKRAHNTCERCGNARATVIHHLTYISVGREPLWALVALCDSCHKELHGNVY